MDLSSVLNQCDQVTSQAMDHDRQGQMRPAIEKYRQAVNMLEQAARTLSPDSSDYQALKEHQQQILNRVTYLEQQATGGWGARGPAAADQVPLEQQIRYSNAAMALAASAESAAQRAGGVKTMAAAGAIGAVAGGLLLGPLGLVAGGAGAAYAATRGDKAGEVARGVGQGALGAVDKTKEMNQKYHITEKTTEAAKATYNKAVDFEQKHHIGEKVGKGFQWMGDKAKEAEQKYHITDRVTEGAKTATQLIGSGIASGMSAISNAMSKSSGPTTGAQQQPHGQQQNLSRSEPPL